MKCSSLPLYLLLCVLLSPATYLHTCSGAEPNLSIILLDSYQVSPPLQCAHAYPLPPRDLEIWHTSIIALIILHYDYWFTYLSASLDKFREDKDYIF